MAHFAGLVAAGLHPNPVPHCDFVTSTTHKTLAGPRAGFVLCREEHAQASTAPSSRACRAARSMHTIAAKATCFKIAASEAFRAYQAQVRANADALADTLQRRARTCSPAERTPICSSSTSARTRLDRQGRGGTAGRGRAYRQPEHRAVRRAAADGCVGVRHRHSGRHDARLRRGRLPRSRRDHRRRTRRRRPTSTRSRLGAGPCATSGRSIRGSAGSPSLRADGRGEPAARRARRRSSSTTRWSGTSSAFSATSAPRRASSAGSSTS